MYCICISILLWENRVRVARVRKFKINVTSHLKTIIFIIKDIQISKCDIIFENGRFSAFEG